MTAPPDPAAALAASRARNTNEEGIEMLVGLEDLTGAAPPPRPAPGDAELAAAARTVLGALAADPERPTLAEQAAALEVLAAADFGRGA